MAIKHAAVKAPGQKLFAVVDWNANHTIDPNTITAAQTQFADQDLKIASSPTFSALTITNNIIVGGDVDGVDISDFKTSYDAHDHSVGDPTKVDHVDLLNKGVNTHAQIDTHITTYGAHDHSAADPTQVDHADLINVTADQHHARQHALSSAADHTGGITLTQHGDLSGDALTKHKWAQISNKPATFPPSAHGLVSASHTGAGLTIGHVVRATGPAAFAWQQLQHGDLGGVAANQHHAQLHAASHHIAGGDLLAFASITGFSTYLDQAVKTTSDPVFVEPNFAAIEHKLNKYSGTDMGDSFAHSVFFQVDTAGVAPARYYRILRMKMLSAYSAVEVHGLISTGGSLRYGAFQNFHLNAITGADPTTGASMVYNRFGKDESTIKVYYIANGDGANHAYIDVYVLFGWYKGFIGNLNISATAACPVTIWQAGLDCGAGVPTGVENTTYYDTKFYGTISAPGGTSTNWNTAYSLSHARQHALNSAADHTGTITDAQHGVRTLVNAHAHGHLSGIGVNDHHAQSHNIASHSDTTATGAELNTLTDDSMADTLHRHSELSASDGVPNRALIVDAAGNVGIGTAAPVSNLSFGANPSFITMDTVDGSDNKIMVISGGGGLGPTRGAGMTLFGNEAGGILGFGSGNNADINFSAGTGNIVITLASLPVANPAKAGALWRDGTDLKVSLG